jgi:hypothetical protein
MEHVQRVVKEQRASSSCRNASSARTDKVVSISEEGDAMRFLIVTGLSGSGRPSRCDAEDLGALCVDNLPPPCSSAL